MPSQHLSRRGTEFLSSTLLDFQLRLKLVSIRVSNCVCFNCMWFVVEIFLQKLMGFLKATEDAVQPNIQNSNKTETTRGRETLQSRMSICTLAPNFLTHDGNVSIQSNLNDKKSIDAVLYSSDNGILFSLVRIIRRWLSFRM